MLLTTFVLLMLLVAADVWLVMPRKLVYLNDIDCGSASASECTNDEGQPCCKVCGGTAAVARQCSKTMHRGGGCFGFVMENNDCGYLKSSVGTTAQKESPSDTLYCRPSQKDCEGAPTAAGLAQFDLTSPGKNPVTQPSSAYA